MSGRQKAVGIDVRVGKIEKDVGAMEDKLNLILATMKERADLPCKSSFCNSDKAEEPWEEVKVCGRPKHKPKKPWQKPRSMSTASSSSSSDELESEGETKKCARKHFVGKDFKSKYQEIVNVCVKPVDENV